METDVGIGKPVEEVGDSKVSVLAIFKDVTWLVNLIALVAYVLQTQIGFIISPEEQIAVIVVINLILRFLRHIDVIRE